MQKFIWLVLIAAFLSTAAFGAGASGGGSREIETNTAVTALGLLAGWVAVIRGRRSKKQATPADPADASRDKSTK